MKYAATKYEVRYYDRKGGEWQDSESFTHEAEALDAAKRRIELSDHSYRYAELMLITEEVLAEVSFRISVKDTT